MNSNLMTHDDCIMLTNRGRLTSIYIIDSRQATERGITPVFNKKNLYGILSFKSELPLYSDDVSSNL